MHVRAGDILPISCCFSRDWEPVTVSDTPKITILRGNMVTGIWDIPVSNQDVVKMGELIIYNYTTESGYYQYYIQIVTTDTTVDQQKIVLPTMLSGGYTDDIARILGLVHENIYIDNTSYDANDNLISARLRIYSDSASVGTDSNVIGTYTITVTANGAGKFTDWKMVKS